MDVKNARFQYTDQVSLNYCAETSEQLYGETDVSEIAYWSIILHKFYRWHVRLPLKRTFAYVPFLPRTSMYSLPWTLYFTLVFIRSYFQLLHLSHFIEKDISQARHHDSSLATGLHSYILSVHLWKEKEITPFKEIAQLEPVQLLQESGFTR